MAETLMLKIAGEIGTKSPRTRRRFLRVLGVNVRAALERAGVRGRLEPRWSRLLVHTDAGVAARGVLARVFGVHSVSRVVTVPFEGLDDLVAAVAHQGLDRG
ncbi:MAG TPA: hypothetical protein VHL78_08895, partial [Actinomycetota bacterium]|nr:hypothetical protein [Actinomycetota bacterium]